MGLVLSRLTSLRSKMTVFEVTRLLLRSRPGRGTLSSKPRLGGYNFVCSNSWIEVIVWLNTWEANCSAGRVCPKLMGFAWVFPVVGDLMRRALRYSAAFLSLSSLSLKASGTLMFRVPTFESLAALKELISRLMNCLRSLPCSAKRWFSDMYDNFPR